MIYFISDFHFGHKNILNFERKQFNTIEEHDQYIISIYNKVVKKDDTCYILGDIGASGFNVSKEYLIKCFKQLNGKKIIILGNHDRYPKSFYKELYGVTEVYDHPVYLSKRIALSHEPIKVDDDVLNIHGHLHGATLNLPNYLTVSAHLINYKPVSYKLIMNILNKIPKCSKRFMEEWYAEYYNFSEKRNDIIYKDNGLIDIHATKTLKKI